MLLPTITTLGIIDPNPMICQGFSVVMHKLSNTFVTTFMAHSCKEMLQQSSAVFPSIMVVSFEYSLDDALETVKWLHENHADIYVVAFGYQYPKGSKYKLGNAGCIGYLYKDDNEEVLQNAIEDIIEKGYFKNKRSDIFQELKHVYIDEKPIGKTLELLHQICSEKSYKEIGASLFKSPRTIEENATELCLNLHVHNRYGLICKAYSEKWIEVN